ncbi:hypothetical protein CFC21_055179 [Triticum aestivum]|uniref:F-box domain-containing protein n=2 Tax=Triticum aestivum TaxID=4565 RepID=A0A3B6I546_WHEAT|nr:hypothetical protein CFC21_055179 [Triticum aestivum]
MPQLPDELVEEIFLHLPPDEPAALVRASLASKPWLALLTGPAFRARYREFHGAPPMLGLFYSRPDDTDDEEDPDPPFVSTTKFAVRIPHFIDPTYQRFDAWDCRHGRVLLVDNGYSDPLLGVWDPITDCTRELVGLFFPDSFGVAVLCAVSGCDHRACHAGPFRVVYVGLEYSEDEDGECVAVACVSSPDIGDWSKPRPDSLSEWNEQCPDLDLVAAADAFIRPMPSVLVNDALHFLLGYKHDDDRVEILKYSLSSDSLSLIDAPLAESVVFHAPILMAMKNGTLGFAHVDRLTLYVWSRQIDSDGGASWTRLIVVDVKNLLPIKNPKRGSRLVGSVEGSDIIFVKTDLGIYEIDLKTLEWKERHKGENVKALFPYMSFYDPSGIYIPFMILEQLLAR